MTVVLIAIATFISTLVGGLFALRFKDKLHLILGFSAGAVIGVAFFDLMPEAISLGSQFFQVSTIGSMIAVGFVAYLLLDRLIFLHAHGHDYEHGNELEKETQNMNRGILGAGSLSIHSLLDGIAIGLAFQVSMAIGAVVAIAVLVHDFSDGINTVGLILKGSGADSNRRLTQRKAFRWLIADATAPVVGAASTLFFTLPESALSIILALFCGFFLYIGASDLIPESHHAHPRFLTTSMTIIGVGVLFLAIKLAGI